MMNSEYYDACPYMDGQLQGQLLKVGSRDSVFLLLCAVGSLLIYLLLRIQIRLIGNFLKVSWKMCWNRRAVPTADPLLRVEDFLTRNAKWKRSFVQAENPPTEGGPSLTNLDRSVNPTFSSVILFFPVTNSMKNCGNVAKKLKKSLAEVLSVFYPLAGRLKVTASGLVELVSNNKGAVFLEVDVDQYMKAFGDLQPTHALSGLNSEHVTNLIGKTAPYLPDQITPMPVLIVQLTTFKCGSTCLGINWHHTVADGSSGCHFVNAWAEVASGKGISLQPDHNRALLSPRNPRDPSLVDLNLYRTKVTENSTSQDAGQKPAVIKNVFISREKVDAIKKQIQREAEMYPEYAQGRGARPYTSAECMSAWFWRAFMRARYASPTMEPDRVTRFFMFVDGRAKLNLPKGYFGNVVCSACALTTEKRLDREPLVYAAYLIRKAVEGVSGEYFRSLVDWVETHGLCSAKPEHVNSVGQDVAGTFWNRFPIYKMDFGWGKPAFGARNSPPRDLIDGFSVMPSNTDNAGDTNVLLNLQADRLERLQQDETYRKLEN